MEVLGDVIAEVFAFSSALFVLAVVGVGVYMRVSHRDPFTGKATHQPRSRLQYLYLLFSSLLLFTTAIFRLVPNSPNIVRFALLAAEILFGVLFTFFFIKFLRVWRREARTKEANGANHV